LGECGKANGKSRNNRQTAGHADPVHIRPPTPGINATPCADIGFAGDRPIADL
jgi:hypothetical protein